MYFKKSELLEAYKKDVYNFTLNLENKFKKKKNITVSDIYEIMLWKLSRFPNYDKKPIDKKITDIFDELKECKSITTNQDKEFVKEKIKELLKVKGFKLPMISTILFFINPDVFQIIDKRVNRIVMGNNKDYSKNFKNNSVEYYLEYLEKLHELEEEKFSKSGQIFYQLDKEKGFKLDSELNPEEIKKIQNEYKKENPQST